VYKVQKKGKKRGKGTSYALYRELAVNSIEYKKRKKKRKKDLLYGVLAV